MNLKQETTTCNPFFSFFGDRFVINLDSEKKRLHSFYQTMNAYGILNVTRVPAVPHWQGLTGCAHSHLNIIKEAQRRGLDSVFVFEDDVEFIDLDIAALNSIILYLRNNPWDFLRMSYTYHGSSQHLEEGRDLGLVSRRHPSLVELKKELGARAQSESHNIGSGQLCNQAASAYNSTVFDKVIKEFDPETCPPNDVWLPRNLDSLCITPQMAIQGEPPPKRESHLTKKEMCDTFFSTI